MKNNILKKGGILFFLLLVVLSVSLLSSTFITPDRLAWYKTLPLSSLTPPDIVFSFIWTVLYFLMAISAFLVWNKTSPRYFVLQLITNGLWPFLFFYMHNPIAGLIDIFLMIIFICLTMKTFYKASKTAAYLFIPLLIWSIFAFYLNAHIVYYLN